MQLIEPAFSWKVAPADRSRTTQWMEALGVSRIVAHIVGQRGADTLESARRFLNPGLANMSDPHAMLDMDAAVSRIKQARDRDEPVLIYGDYDADGVSGTVVLTRALQRFGVKQVAYDLPSRMVDGYGLHPGRVAEARDAGVQLIVTVDNGINAREAAQLARESGIDLIITDHHQLEGELPPAVAIVDPVREDSSVPYAQASGAAVAFKLGWALTGSAEDMDIAAVGTVADIVPLRGENRDLVAAGLERMRQRPLPGLSALATAAGIRIEEVTAENIAFQLAPRINAVGRMQEAHAALELLLTDSPMQASRLASVLHHANEERRSIESAILKDAVEEIEATLEAEQRSIVLARRGWHSGVIGIVASQLMTRYARPVVLIALDEEGIGRGSARCAREFDMVGALAVCGGLLEQFGGHLAAAGMTVRGERLEAFRDAFEAEAQRRMPEGVIKPQLDIDAIVPLALLDAQFVRSLEWLQPFGYANPAPVFCANGVQVLPDSVRELRGGHLKCTVRQGAKVMDAVGFRMGDRFSADLAREPIDIAFAPQFNTWRGETTLQLVLKDIASEGCRR